MLFGNVHLTKHEEWNQTLAISTTKTRIAANICGIASLMISSLYWACILLPKPCWPTVCPWGHSMERFLDFMFAGLVLGLVAAWKGRKLWVGAAVLAFASLCLGGVSV